VVAFGAMSGLLILMLNAL